MAYPILAPNSTWYKSSQSRSTITEINIVDSYSGTADETWNADVDNSGSIKCYRTGTVLTIAGNGSGGIYLNPDSSDVFSDSSKVDYFSALIIINGSELLDTYADTSLYRAFNYCSALTTIPHIPNNITNMQAIFQYCESLTNIDMSNCNTSKVTTMRNMFNKCYKLESVSFNGNNVSAVETTLQMFQLCSSLKNVNFTGTLFSANTTTKNMFFECATLQTIIGSAGLVTSACTDIASMFENCGALEHLDVSEWNTSGVMSMNGIFHNCIALKSIDVSKWDTSSCTNTNGAFDHCNALTILDVSNWNTVKVTTYKAMFQNCTSLRVLDVSKWGTSSCTDMGWMFYGCSSLAGLDVSGWNTENVESLHHFTAHCTNLTITGVEKWNVSKCRAFNAVFHGLKNTYYDLSGWDVTNGETFAQMFENNKNLVSVKGLENWNTSKSKDFDEMFSGCTALRELNLSAFDTRQASASWTDEWNGQTGGIVNMFADTVCLQKITLGENFSFNGDGTCQTAVLPTPSAELIEGANGHWYTADGTAYTASEIPNRTAATYYVYIPALAMTDVSAFAINKVEDQEVYETMKSQGKVNDGEIYIIDENVNAVLHSEQYLSEEKKRQARANIGALAIEDLKNASETESGLMSPTDKMRLDTLRNAEMLENKVDEIAANATDEQYPTVTAVKHYVNKGVESVVNRTRSVQSLVTFVDDDGNADVWTKLKPLSEQYGIPFVSAMVTNRIGQDGSLTAEQLSALQDMGWEIASHTMGHIHLGELTDAEQEEQLRGSKEALEAIGLTVDTICYPYSSVSENTWKIARKYYRCGRQTNYREWMNESPLETWDLRCTPIGSYYETQTESGLDTSTLEYYKYQVDRAVSGNAWLIFMTHCAETDETQMGYLAQVIEYVQSLGIPVVTMREALDRRGNIVDNGRWNRRDTSEEHFVVGCDSTVEKSAPDRYAVNLPANSVTNDTPPSAFPVPAVSTCRITGNTAGFPYQSVYYGGTLVTNSMGLSGSAYTVNTDYDSGRMWQEFYTPKSVAVYRRYAIDADTWSDWSYGSDIVLAQDSRTIDDAVSAFPIGTKSKVWLTQDGATAKRPDGINGWLMTDRTDVNGRLYWQTWIPMTQNNPKGNVYFRRWTGAAWDDWTCLGERVGSTNMLGWSTTPKYVGAQVFDTTRGKPVWWNGTAWVEADVDKLDKSGGTMTGALTLAADPTDAMEAATKQYVDNHTQEMSTEITDEATDEQCPSAKAVKDYVDNAIGAAIGGSY